MGLYFFISLIVLVAVAYLSGILVEQYQVKVNYTRKLNHFGHFFLPSILNFNLPYTASAFEIILTSFATLFFFIMFIRPIRQKSKFITTMFASFDRPEDRPYTLIWMVTQIFAAMCALIPIRYYGYWNGYAGLALIPIFINGFGDGLAEPIGIKYGRHHYKTRGFMVDREYTRTWEGSACVFIATIFTLLLFQDNFSFRQLWACLLILPILMTYVEARSPHTWDAPFIYFIGGGFIMFALEYL